MEILCKQDQYHFFGVGCFFIQRIPVLQQSDHLVIRQGQDGYLQGRPHADRLLFYSGGSGILQVSCHAR